MTSAVQVQYRRGTASQVGAFIGAQGEMVVDTTNNRVVVQDGASAGGWPAAKLSEIAGGKLNKFRNGTMDVWQRGTSLTVTTSGGYSADGWIVLPMGASVTAAQAGGRLLTKNSLQVTGATSVTDLIIKQRIESLIAAAFCSQTVTVQVWVYNGTGGAITPKLTVNRPSAQDNYGSATADVNAVNLQSCANGAWTQVAYTFAANGAAYNGLEIVFDFGNNFGSNTKTVQITECDIRVTNGIPSGQQTPSNFIPPPELRHVATETAFCQRYYFRRTSANGGSSWQDVICIAHVFSSGGAWGKMFDLPVTMRTSPTVNISSASHISAYNAAASSYAAFTAAGSWQATPYCVSQYGGFTGASGLVAGNATQLFFNTSSGWIDASAEL